MDGKLAEILSDPRICRIVLDAMQRGHVTAGELCEANPSISRSMMYRLLSKLEREGILEVADRT